MLHIAMFFEDIERFLALEGFKPGFQVIAFPSGTSCCPPMAFRLLAFELWLPFLKKRFYAFFPVLA